MKLFSFHFVALALSCSFQLLFLQVILCASANGDANSTSSCSSSFMQCANLDNITYPFWSSASCAASPSYVLSNCTSSSTQAYWDSFSDVALGVVGSPAVTAVEAVLSVEQYDIPYVGQLVAETSIQLSWNTTLIDLGYCAPPFSSTNLSLYNIPSSINLTRFPDSSALEFSPDNTYLLFNCTHNASDVIAQLGSQNFLFESTSGCGPYKGLCPSLAKTPCFQWSVPTSTKELMLQHVLESLACSHFIFGIASHDEFGSSTWSTGSIELIWTDIECQKCQNASGICMFNTTFPEKFNQCVCSNGSALDFNTQTCSDGNLSNDGCHGGKCNIGEKVGFGVFAIVVVLGIFIVIAVKLGVNFNYIGGMIRESIRDGFLSFIKATIHFAINVLKKTLRKLQSVSIGPNIELSTIDLDRLTERPMEFSYSSIASATKSFSSLVGEGGFGKVYKGTVTLADSSKSDGGPAELHIAVKVLEVRSRHIKKQFLNEVVTIGRIHHVNVVRLLGFCMQEDHEMLVYEYVANRSLDRWLFDKEGRAEVKVLDWGQRYTIALGIARGLSYLHEECRHRTVHCDIKPQNILLDDNMHPKIADFGLAKLMGREESKVMTFAKGTPGYMAPEFWMGGESQLSTKYDVYSYGMVLLELISGQRNFRRDAMASHGSSFPAMAFKAAMEGDFESIVDARLGITNDGDDGEKQAQWHQMKTATYVALWCIQDQPAGRPCMSEVVKYLEGGAPVSETPPQPNVSIFAAPSIVLTSTPQESPCSNSHQDDDCTPLSVGR